MTKTLHRRTLLRGAGGVAMALPFLHVMRGRRAFAAESPKRLLTWFFGMGTIQSQWEPSGGETDFKLSRILQPMEPIKSDIVVLKNVDSHGYGHWHTSANMTGFKPKAGAGEFDGKGPTIDQELARRWKDKTPIGSLVLGVAVPKNSDKNWSIISWSGPKAGILPENNPYAVYERLFMAAPAGGNAIDLAVLRARKRSVIDAARENANRLLARLGTEDKKRLEAYFTSVREIENKLDATKEAAGGTCKAPAAGTTMLDFNSAKNVPALLELQHSLTVAAFACDLTRVVTLMTDGAGTGRNHGPFVPGCDGGWHAVSHEANAGSIEKMVKIHSWYNQQFTSLVQKLKATPDVDGKTLLDNTLVWQQPEYGANVPDGETHQHQRMPYVIAGRAGGAIKTGRLLSFDRNKRPKNNLLLVSIMHAMGFKDVQTYGDPALGSGPLPGLVSG